MKRLLRWIGIALGGLGALGILAYAVMYVLSERVLRRTYEVPPVAVQVPTDTTSISEGRRLASAVAMGRRLRGLCCLTSR